MTSSAAKKRALGALMLGLATAWTAPALAQTKTGTTMGAFLQIEPSGRLSGMGNAGVAMAAGLDGVYYNAAVIADVDHYQVTFTHSTWLADIRYAYIAGTIPMGKWGSAYASLTSLNSGEMTVRTVDQPYGTGEQFTVSDIAIGLGYGIRITDRFAAGGQLTYAQESIWHSSSAAFTLSVGTLYQVADNGLHIGASLSNFGTQAGYDGRDLRITYDQDPSRYGDNGTLPGEVVTGDFPVPILFRVGIGAPFQLSQNARLTLEADALHPNDNSGSMSFGSELLLNRQLAVRAGFQNAFQTDSEEGLTAGAGFASHYGDFQYHIDYAWADHGRLGSVSRFTLGFGF